jgi:hypothetical protein
MGARPVGLDVSEAPLETARALQRDHRVEFPLLHASGESTFLPDRSFDPVSSDYGAAIWGDTYDGCKSGVRADRVPWTHLVRRGRETLAIPLLLLAGGQRPTPKRNDG